MTPDELIDAAAKAHWEASDVTRLYKPFDSLDEPTKEILRQVARAVLAAVLPKVADAIAEERLTDDTGEPEDIAYNAAIGDVLRLVRGWRNEVQP